MTVPTFSLTKKLPITVFRRGQDTYVRGRPVKGEETSFIVEANVQPFNFNELLKLPESDRNREWIKIYIAHPSEIRNARQGSDGWAADEVEWQGDRFTVMRVRNYRMGVLDHCHVIAARNEISAGVQSNG